MQRTVTDLQAIADTASDPAEREEVLKIITRLSHQEEEWPDIDELIRIKLRYASESNE